MIDFARRQHAEGLRRQLVLLADHRVVEAGAIVGGHQLARHVRLVIGHVGPAHHAGRLDAVLLDRVHRELQGRGEAHFHEIRRCAREVEGVEEVGGETGIEDNHASNQPYQNPLPTLKTGQKRLARCSLIN